MDSFGVFTSLNLSKADVLMDATIILPYYDQITNLTNGTVTEDDFNQINEQIEHDLLDTMEEYAIAYTIIGTAVIILGWGQFALWIMAAERQCHRIRKGFFYNIMRQDIGWFDCCDTGEFNTRLTDDINKIRDGIGDKIGSFFQSFTAFIAGFAIGFIYGWKLTLVILAVSPVLAASAALMTKLVSVFSAKELKTYAKAGSVAEEVLSAVRTVIAFGGQKKECQRYNANLSEARDFGVKKGFIIGIAEGFMWCVIFCVYALGFWYGAKLVREDDNYTVGNVMIVFFSVIIAAFSLGNAGPNIQSFGVARGAAYTVYSLIDQEPFIDSASEKGLKPTTMEGTIRFHNVLFTYPSRPNAKVLNGINLQVNRGQTVALVGPSGCGKSTIVQLILRFYDPDSGKVTLDGNDLKYLNVKWLRQHIGIVSQEPVLFGTTIEENIRYGCDDVTLDEIQKAATLANAHDFIMKLPDKYQTLVGERGAQLSGGQKQRVAIARALVRDPKLLLLDEATSALDTESEGVVQDALEKASHGRTTIIIAHRLSTINTADLILGFKDGQIVETGTHDELMKQHGIYSTLVTMQTKQTEDDLEVEEYDKVKPDLKAIKSVEMESLLQEKSSVKSMVPKFGENRVTGVAEQEREKSTGASLKRILRLNAPEWPFIMFGCFGSFFNGGVMPAYAIILADIIGVFSETDEGKQEDQIAMYCTIFVGIGLASWLFMFLQAYMFAKSGEHLTERIRQLTFKAMLRQDVSYFDDQKNSTGALATRLATDASLVQGASGIRLGTTLQGLVSILAGLIIAFVYGWQLTLVILSCMPFIIILGALEMHVLTGIAEQNNKAFEEAGKVAVESVENIRTVASLSREQIFFNNYCKQLDGPHRSAMTKAHIIGFSFSFSNAIIFFSYAVSFYYGAYLIEKGVMDFVNVFKVFSAIVFGGVAVSQASSFAPDASKAIAASSEIFSLLDKEPVIDNESTLGERPEEGQFTSAIFFHNVYFRYPTRPDVMVLNGYEMKVKPGQTVALVGISGCGKSTIVHLIERFYNTVDGHVLLDKYNTSGLNVQWLRRQVGIVSQEPVLFDRSIAENIAYGDNDRVVLMDEIIAAARSANIHNFIKSLPNGYETNVGDKGSQLSGGQKQRIAIARALIRNPKVLLLDEATSALDSESEKLVQEALDKAREGRTCIVIAHRLSTIQNADNIYVIRHGVVTEEGRHNELMAKQGFYYKLNMAQVRQK